MTIKYIIQNRRGTSERWKENQGIVPLEGEFVVELDLERGQHKFKIGDGIRKYKDLPYFTPGAQPTGDITVQDVPKITNIVLSDTWEMISQELYSQKITIEGITCNSRVDLQPPLEVLSELKQLGITLLTENNNGDVTVYAIGNRPRASYVVQATIVETVVEELMPILSMPVSVSSANMTQVDWNQEDDTRIDYIKNKPFGDQVIIGRGEPTEKTRALEGYYYVDLSTGRIYQYQVDPYDDEEPPYWNCIYIAPYDDIIHLSINEASPDCSLSTLAKYYRYKKLVIANDGFILTQASDTSAEFVKNTIRGNHTILHESFYYQEGSETGSYFSETFDIPQIDKLLIRDNFAADAKVVGDKFKEIDEKLGNASVTNIDTTLTKEGYAADANAVGKTLSDLEDRVDNIELNQLGIRFTDDGSGNVTISTVATSSSEVVVTDDGEGNVSLAIMSTKE